MSPFRADFIITALKVKKFLKSGKYHSFLFCPLHARECPVSALLSFALSSSGRNRERERRRKEREARGERRRKERERKERFSFVTSWENLGIMPIAPTYTHCPVQYKQVNLIIISLI